MEKTFKQQLLRLLQHYNAGAIGINDFKMQVADKLLKATPRDVVNFVDDTARHEFVPSADRTLCAVCGEHLAWHGGNR